MHHHDQDDIETIARNTVGAVTRCPCGVFTVTLQFLNIRLEASAFKELQVLLNQAQTALNSQSSGAKTCAPISGNSSQVH